MNTKSVQALLDDLRLLNASSFEIVQAVRRVAQATCEDLSEEVKYGGILFSSGTQFGGVFAYKDHVTVELSSGASIEDVFGFLEGAGKRRRHIKLTSTAQIEQKSLSAYLALALQAAEKKRIAG